MARRPECWAQMLSLLWCGGHGLHPAGPATSGKPSWCPAASARPPLHLWGSRSWSPDSVLHSAPEKGSPRGVLPTGEGAWGSELVFLGPVPQPPALEGEDSNVTATASRRSSGGWDRGQAGARADYVHPVRGPGPQLPLDA